MSDTAVDVHGLGAPANEAADRLLHLELSAQGIGAGGRHLQPAAEAIRVGHQRRVLFEDVVAIASHQRAGGAREDFGGAWLAKTTLRAGSSKKTPLSMLSSTA